MSINIVTHETLPIRGGVATWVDVLSSSLEKLGERTQVITSSPCKYDNAIILLPKRFLSLEALIKFIGYYRFYKKNERILVCDAGGIIFSFMCFILGCSKRITIVFHGTEIIRLTKKFKKIGLEGRFKRFIQSTGHMYISNVVKNIVDDTMGASPGTVIYNSSNISENNMKVRAISNNGSVKIIIVGRLDPRKRTDKLIKSLKLIERNVELNIVGDGYCMSSLKVLSNKYKKDKDIINFHGRVDDDKLVSLYKSSDLVFVGAGRANNAVEGFGLTVLEAIQHGTVPISIDLDGPGEISKVLRLPKANNDIKSIADVINVLSLGRSIKIEKSEILNFSTEVQAERIRNYINE